MAKRKIAAGLVSIGSIARLLFIAIATFGIYFSLPSQPAYAAECAPDDIECIGYAEYCIDHSSNVACTGRLEYCDALGPDSSSCAGFTVYCEENPNSGPCIGNATYCANNPNVSSCMGRTLFCEQNPNDSGCLGKVAMCAGRETEGTCPQDIAYCNTYPQNSSCVGLIKYCDDNPSNSNCTGMTAYCNENQTHPTCTGYTAYCPLNPDVVACKGYLSSCAGNETSGICQGYTDYCPQFPDDIKCLGTKAVDESTPPNFQAECSESGESVNLSWYSVEGVSTYALRINYVSNDDASCLPDGWLCDDKDWSGDTAGTSYSRTIIPDKPYTAWIHSRIAGTTGPAASLEFTCAPPQVSCATDPELPSCPGSDAYCALDAHKNEPICQVGNPAWCNSGYHNNNENCPGTMPYCDKYPADPLCDVIDKPGYSDGTTSFSVYETSKSTGVGTVLCNGMYYIKSNIGAPLATLIVLSIGVLAMVRKVSWKRIILVCVGISSIFGASQLTTFVGSNVAEEEDAVLKCLTNE